MCQVIYIGSGSARKINNYIQKKGKIDDRIRKKLAEIVNNDQEFQIVVQEGITEIKENAFSVTDNDNVCEKLTSVIISKDVTKIGEKAFCGCVNLKSVEIEKESKMEVIEDYAFFNCSELKCFGNKADEGEAKIPDTVKEIGEGAFFCCNSLQLVLIPDSVETIKAGAFSGCAALKNVIINKGIQTVEQGAFCCCSELTTVSVPNKHAEIGCNAFKNTKCTSFPVSPSLEEIEIEHVGTNEIDKKFLEKTIKHFVLPEYGWMETEYRWPQSPKIPKKEDETIFEFNHYSQELRQAIDKTECIRKILKWGGITRKEDLIPVFSKAIKTIKKNSINGINGIKSLFPKDMCKLRIASWSKILAAYLPGICFIYDSRVAIALCQISMELGVNSNWNLLSPKMDGDKKKQEVFERFKNACHYTCRNDPEDIFNCYCRYLNLLEKLAQHTSVQDAYRKYVEEHPNIKAAYTVIGLSDKQAIKAHIEKMLFMQKDTILDPFRRN